MSAQLFQICFPSPPLPAQVPLRIEAITSLMEYHFQQPAALPTELVLAIPSTWEGLSNGIAELGQAFRGQYGWLPHGSGVTWNRLSEPCSGLRVLGLGVEVWELVLVSQFRLMIPTPR